MFVTFVEVMSHRKGCEFLWDRRDWIAAVRDQNI